MITEPTETSLRLLIWKLWEVFFVLVAAYEQFWKLCMEAELYKYYLDKQLNHSYLLDAVLFLPLPT